MMRHSGAAEEIRSVAKTDNRIFFRNPLFDVQAQIKNVNTGDRFDAFVKDISGSGMGFNTSREFSQGAILEISLEIPDGFGPLKLLGRVVWSQAAEFTPIEKDFLAGFAGVRTGVVILNPRFMSVARILKLFF